jgi:hypothetical protein
VYVCMCVCVYVCMCVCVYVCMCVCPRGSMHTEMRVQMKAQCALYVKPRCMFIYLHMCAARWYTQGAFWYRILLVDYAVEMFTSVVFPFLAVHLCNRCYHACTKNKPGRGRRTSLYGVTLDQMDPKQRAKALKRQAKVNEKQKDIIKQEFDIPNNIIDLVYRQFIVWTACFVAPFIVVMSVVLSALLIQIKRGQVYFYTRRPRRPMPISTQHRYVCVSTWSPWCVIHQLCVCVDECVILMICGSLSHTATFEQASSWLSPWHWCPLPFIYTRR